MSETNVSNYIFWHLTCAGCTAGVAVNRDDSLCFTLSCFHSPLTPSRSKTLHKVSTHTMGTNNPFRQTWTHSLPHTHARTHTATEPWPYHCFLLGCFPFSHFISIQTTDGALCLEDILPIQPSHDTRTICPLVHTFYLLKVSLLLPYFLFPCCNMIVSDHVIALSLSCRQQYSAWICRCTCSGPTNAWRQDPSSGQVTASIHFPQDRLKCHHLICKV